jgi:hypothetical protein
MSRRSVRSSRLWETPADDKRRASMLHKLPFFSLLCGGRRRHGESTTKCGNVGDSAWADVEAPGGALRSLSSISGDNNKQTSWKRSLSSCEVVFFFVLLQFRVSAMTNRLDDNHMAARCCFYRRHSQKTTLEKQKHTNSASVASVLHKLSDWLCFVCDADVLGNRVKLKRLKFCHEAKALWDSLPSWVGGRGEGG